MMPFMRYLYKVNEVNSERGKRIRLSVRTLHYISYITGITAMVFIIQCVH